MPPLQRGDAMVATTSVFLVVGLSEDGLPFDRAFLNSNPQTRPDAANRLPRFLDFATVIAGLCKRTKSHAARRPLQCQRRPGLRTCLRYSCHSVTPACPETRGASRRLFCSRSSIDRPAAPIADFLIANGWRFFFRTEAGFTPNSKSRFALITYHPLAQVKLKA
jgi:hypothetical protein